LELDPFRLQSVNAFIPEDVMVLVWKGCSVPDLLTLTLVSRSSWRDARQNLLTMDRLIELWQGSPSLPAVLLESSRCIGAFAAPEDHTGMAQSRLATGMRAARILAEGVQWILQTRLNFPKNHVLLRFFASEHPGGIQVCNVTKMASSPDVEHYVLRCRASNSSNDVYLHMSMNHKLSATELAWQPSQLGRLLGSVPWQVASAVQH